MITLTMTEDEYDIVRTGLLELRGRVMLPVLAKLDNEVYEQNKKEEECQPQTKETKK